MQINPRFSRKSLGLFLLLTGLVVVAFQNCGKFQTGIGLKNSSSSQSAALTPPYDANAADLALADKLDELLGGLKPFMDAAGINLVDYDVLAGATIQNDSLTFAQISLAQSHADPLIDRGRGLLSLLPSSRVGDVLNTLNAYSRSGLSAQADSLLTANIEILNRMQGLATAPVPSVTPSATPVPTPVPVPTPMATPVAMPTANPTAAPAPASNTDAQLIDVLRSTYGTMTSQMRQFGLNDTDIAVLDGDMLASGRLTAAAVTTAQTNADSAIRSRAAFIRFTNSAADIASSLRSVRSAIASISAFPAAGLTPVAAQLQTADLEILRRLETALVNAS